MTKQNTRRDLFFDENQLRLPVTVQNCEQRKEQRDHMDDARVARIVWFALTIMIVVLGAIFIFT
jgi:hypothetical protein